MTTTVQNQQGNQNAAYYVPRDSHGKQITSDDQIIKKTPLIGARITADKLVNDVFTYAPKGLQGSRNSNFYEFLSLGLVPNIIGSLTLIGLFNAANKSYNQPARHFAGMTGRNFAAGVILYTVGKWVGNKLINKGVEAQTGVDLEMPYRKVVTEFQENPNDKDLTAIEFHRVFESADFPRWDLLNKYGEQHGDRYIWYDKIAKKMGFKDKLNSPDQTVQPKVKETVVKATAAKSISGYIWAALGVALAAQEPFKNKMMLSNASVMDKAKTLSVNMASTLKNSFLDLYNGNNKSFVFRSKYVGRTLIFAAAASTVLGIWNSVRGFKIGKNQPDTQIDPKQKYEVK